MRRYRSGGGLSGFDGTLALIILGIIALPIVGVMMMTKEDSESKAIGLVLLVVGIIIYAFAFN